MNEHRLLDIIGQIYEAAADSARLGAVGSLIAGAVGSDSSLVFVAHQPSAKLIRLVSASENFDAQAACAYRDYYHGRNEWFLRGAQRPPGFIGRGSDLIAYSDFDKTEFCNDWCKRIDIYHLLAATFPLDANVLGAIGVHRPKRSQPFGDEDRRVLSAIVPHLARSLQTDRRLRAARRDGDLNLEILRELGVGVLLLDSQCRLLFMNALAERLIKAARWLTLSRGVVRTTHPGGAAEFEKAVSRASSTSAGTGLSAGNIVQLSDPHEPSLAVLVAPFRAEMLALGPMRPAAVVIFSDPAAAKRPLVAAVSDVYGLTRAESRLAVALVEGHSLPSYARQTRVSVNTLKTQLRSIFQKTGFVRQSALVGSILANPVLRLHAQCAEEFVDAASKLLT
jgi:DNA-binding CsgD family transcriptional regulator